jgi:archaellum component FlaF (FlaF/FlaG flagellin family)
MPSLSYLYAQAQFPNLQHEVLGCEFSQVLKDGILVTEDQQQEEIFGLHMYEISLLK